jgi:hypothetical protein
MACLQLATFIVVQGGGDIENHTFIGLSNGCIFFFVQFVVELVILLNNSSIE